MDFSRFNDLETFEEFLRNNEIPGEYVPAAVDRLMALSLVPEVDNDRERNNLGDSWLEQDPDFEEAIRNMDQNLLDGESVPVVEDHQIPETQEGRGKKRKSTDQENVPPTKKFRCSTCEKEFTRSFNLKRHEKSHLGTVKNFECSNCHKKFDSKFNRDRHEREVHEKELKCDKCGMEFSDKVSFNKHAQSAHRKRKRQEISDNSGKSNSFFTINDFEY